MSNFVEVRAGTTLLRDYKRIVEGTKIRVIEDGSTAASYRVLLDVDRLRHYVERAYRNKGGKCTAGPLKIEIVDRVKARKGVAHGS